MRNVVQWLWYWLQLPGCPFGARADEADVILVQAFGRNHLADNDLANLRRYHDEHGGRDAVTLAWCRDHVEVGSANRSLAMELMDLVHHSHLPVIAQWEVIVPLPISWYERHQSRIICLWPSAVPGEYFSTVDVLAKALTTMTEHRWDSPLVLAHAGQVMRCAMLIRRELGRWPAIPPNLPNEFDRDSVQPWTRNRAAWMWHEFLARGHHVVRRLV